MKSLDLSEDVVEHLSHHDLLIELVHGVLVHLGSVLVDQVVELDVSGVDIVSSLDRGGLGLLALRRKHPLVEEVIGDTEGTELEWVGEVNLSEHDLVLGSEGLSLDVEVSIFHPNNRVKVSEAGSEVDSSDGGIVTTVGSPRGLSGVGGGGGIDVDSGRKTGEHGSGLTSLEVVDKSAVHLVLVHVSDGGEEVVGVEVGIWEGDETWSSVVGEVEEDLIG